MLTFNEDHLIQQLEILPSLHRVAFAASCSERLLPNYQAFVVTQKWGDYKRLRNTLDTIWSMLRGASLTSDRIRSLLEDCQVLGPDSEDFTSVWTQAAQNAAGSVYYALECYLSSSASAAALSARVAIDTIDGYLLYVGDPIIDVHAFDYAMEAWVEQSPFMQAELNKQQQDIVKLHSVRELSLEFLSEFRKRSTSPSIDPINRGLI